MSRSNSSILWNYFEKHNDIEKKAKCHLCGDSYSYKGTTGNLKMHLKKRHLDAYSTVVSEQQLSSSSLPSTSLAQLQPNIASTPLVTPSLPSTSSSVELARPQKRQQTLERYGNTKKISSDMKRKIDRDLLDLFIDGYQPFSLVEEKGFKKFASWIPGYQLPSRKTISNVMIPAIYNQTKAALKQKLMMNNNTVFCLTTDLWTSRANVAYIAVTAHYMTEEFELKTALLECSNFTDSHSSANIQTVLTEIVVQWALMDKINLVVSDNATNIQKALNNLGWKHFGCYGHTLNLIVQDAMKGVSNVLDKVKKIVRHFKTSSTALEKFLKAQTDDHPDCIPKRLLQEVPTRWNSSFRMIQRFVELEQYVRTTMALLKHDFPIISNEEWTVLTELSKILKPFDEATETISGENYMTGSLIIVMTRALITACDKLNTESFVQVSKNTLNSLRTGLVSRYGNIERNRMFATCTFLDPRYKLSVFSDTNKQTTRSCVQDKLVDLIRKENVLEEPLPTVASKNISQFKSLINELAGTHQRNVGTPLSKAIKEIDTYLNDDPLPVFNGDKWSCPIEWWRGHKHTYPYLAKLYRLYGNVMGTSVPCERLFSKAGLIISDRRTRLTSMKVKQLTFLNVNLGEN